MWGSFIFLLQVVIVSTLRLHASIRCKVCESISHSQFSDKEHIKSPRLYWGQEWLSGRQKIECQTIKWAQLTGVTVYQWTCWFFLLSNLWTWFLLDHSEKHTLICTRLQSIFFLNFHILFNHHTKCLSALTHILAWAMDISMIIENDGVERENKFHPLEHLGGL